MPATMVVMLVVGFFVLLAVAILAGSRGASEPQVICRQAGCGHANPRKARYCGHCGHLLETTAEGLAAPPFAKLVTAGFQVILLDAGASKLQVIKAVRMGRRDLGLKEAKNLVDTAPQVLGRCATRDAAEQWKTWLQEAGAVVRIEEWQASDKEATHGGSNA